MKKVSHYRNELLCGHGIGHGPHIHNCDGCCAPLVHSAEDAEQARIIKLLYKHSPNEFGKELVYEEASLCGDLCHLCSEDDWSWLGHIKALIKGKAN